MPVRIFGGGGGRIIKDATALPGDVRNGKVFYNNSGRQEGIWNPVELKSILLPPGKANIDSERVTLKLGSRWDANIETMNFNFNYFDTNSYYYYYVYKSVIKYDVIAGVKINGKMYYTCITKAYDRQSRICITHSKFGSIETDMEIFFDSGNIYVSVVPENMSVEVLYL